MKWYSTKTHTPPSNDTVIARIRKAGDGCILFTSAVFEDDRYFRFIWPTEPSELQGMWEVTHFIIPDALELED